MAWNAIPILAVSDVSNARDYFCERLGFQCIGAHEPAGEMVYGIVTRQGATFHLQLRPAEVLSERSDQDTDAFVLVDDVDAVYAEYTKMGVPIHRAIQDEPYGVRDFTIETPMGPRIAFATEIE